MPPDQPRDRGPGDHRALFDLTGRGPMYAKQVRADPPDIPLVVDDLKRLTDAGSSGESRAFDMTRCTYLAVQVSGAVDDWVSELRRREVPFLVFGPTIALHRPDERRSRFTDPQAVEALLDAVEAIEGLVVEIEDVWLPNFLVESCLGEALAADPAAVRGEVIRVRIPLFQEALLFARGMVDEDRFLDHCRSLIEGADAGERAFARSADEAEVFREWTRIQIDEARENYLEQREDGRGVLAFRDEDGSIHEG